MRIQYVKIKKNTFPSFFCILILTILIPVLLDFHKVSGLGLQLFRLEVIHLEADSFMGYYLLGIFSGALWFLKSFNLTTDVSDSFYPKRRLEIQLAGCGWKPMLKNSAIEGFRS